MGNFDMHKEKIGYTIQKRRHGPYYHIPEGGSSYLSLFLPEFVECFKLLYISLLPVS